MFLKIQWLKVSNEFTSPCIVTVNKDKTCKKIIDPKTGNALNSITCRVTGAKIEAFNYIDKMSKKESTGIAYKLYIENKDKAHIFDIGTSRVGRQILNSLLSATPEQLEEVLISVYRNKAGFNAVFVAHKGEPLPWAIEPDELKTLVEQTKNKNGEVVDTDATLFNDKVSKMLEEKTFPARLAKREQTNALDFLDDDIDIEPQWETYEQALAKEQAQKQSSKVADTLDISDLPFN